MALSLQIVVFFPAFVPVLKQKHPNSADGSWESGGETKVADVKDRKTKRNKPFVITDDFRTMISFSHILLKTLLAPSCYIVGYDDV